MRCAPRVGGDRDGTVITTDDRYRRGKPRPLKEAVEQALGTGDGTRIRRRVLVVRRTGDDLNWVQGRDDVGWEDTVDGKSDTR